MSNENITQEEVNKEIVEEQNLKEQEVDEKENSEPEKEDTNIEKEQIEMLKKELEEANKKYLYLAAEYDNYRKRTTKEKESSYSDGAFDTLKDLLMFVDDFDRAMESPCTDDAYKAGISMVAKKLTEYLKNHNVEEIDTTCEFTPELHNAVMHEQDENKPESYIDEVFQKGYKINGKVARPAMVKVIN